MLNLTELYNLKPPEILYHYTTHSGFLGIAKSKYLWCTSIRYLNDGREFLHAIDLLIGRINYNICDSVNKSYKDNEKEFLLNIESGLDRIGSYSFYVGSFSENPDLLSQWRAYSPGVDGVSIGIDSNELKTSANNHAFRLVKCVYEMDQKYSIIDEIIEDFLNKHFKIIDEDTLFKFAVYFSTIAPIFKHESFKEEQEWRLISMQMDSRYPNIDLHQGATILIPHYNFALPLVNDNLNLEDIYVGPSINQKLASNSILIAALKYGIKWKRMIHSMSPYMHTKY